jgi:exo-beta-1,3-glucanase (GH17 family)
MKTRIQKIITFLVLIIVFGCEQKNKHMNKTAAEILGNPNYLAISYGGYRANSRDIQPTINELKDDMKILSAMGVKILRTYNVQLQQAPNLLAAIQELKNENPTFEMYVMLGAWIDCENAWTGLEPNHDVESDKNAAEIDRAVALANKYPDIVKVIAVGNEAMVKWATSYFVQPNVILKWVNHLQELKKSGKLDKNLWVTSSDDFSSWGGGDHEYRTPDLENLIRAVDYVSMHTYPMHNTYYNPSFWVVPENEISLSKEEKIEKAMRRALRFAQEQYNTVAAYVKTIAPKKTIHIGETGWATLSSGHYGPNSSKAADEYKEGMYYKMMREWTNKENISCFYFEAFDENWKDAANPSGSENHFGLINLEGEVKYALWDLFDAGKFNGLTRNGVKLKKTMNGNNEMVLEASMHPPMEVVFVGN